MHELAHGLGPTTVTTPAGETMQVNRALRDTYSALEELKADVTGLHNMTILEARGVFDDQFVRAAFAGHIADLLRAVRFGASEAHGKANLIQFNWLREKGALKPAIGDETETAPGSLQEDVLFTADLDAVRAANRELAAEVLMIEATGDYDRANAFVAQYGTVSEELTGLLSRLDGKVPVDIRPVYSVLDKMAGWH
jgi:hypothetical protein